MSTAVELLLAAVALYPVITAALWIAGGTVHRLLDEHALEPPADGEWPPVSVLVPAYNEEHVIGTNVTAALASDYPELELIVLDDGSTDETEAAAIAAAAGDARCHVLRDPVNRGKADRLNEGFARASHDLVVVTDADTHLHPQAVRLLVTRMLSSPLLAAVAGAPHVTNRGRLLSAMQVLEAASIIGLIRRTQALTGRVGTVAGVLGLFRRDRVLAVGGYDSRMATEDIDLTWRLLEAGWHTTYEPDALVGMQVPVTLKALWAQRRRWARGQGEVLHVHLREVAQWRRHRVWLVALESLASLIWVLALVASLVIALVSASVYHELLGFGLAWGIAIAVVATVQLVIALQVDLRHERLMLRAFLLGPIYPVAYWTIGAAAALREQVTALARGPRRQRVVWDIPRERIRGG
jgi:biofilm PGA synthesis N-glycosyltransferase PgaC